jgi:hypothetical protein
MIRITVIPVVMVSVFGYLVPVIMVSVFSCVVSIFRLAVLRSIGGVGVYLLPPGIIRTVQRPIHASVRILAAPPATREKCNHGQSDNKTNRKFEYTSRGLLVLYRSHE